MASMADRSPDGVGERRIWWSRRSRRETAYTPGGRPEEVLSPEAAKTWQAALDARLSVQATLTRSVALPHAEDITQQTMLELWRYLTSDNPEPVENVRGWMATVSTRRMIDHKRALVRKAEILVGDETALDAAADVPPESTPDSMRALHRKAREMAKALDGLVSPWEAEVVVLHKAYRLPAAEVAAMLETEEIKVTEGAVRSATYTALKKLGRQKRQVLHRFGKADSERAPERHNRGVRTRGETSLPAQDPNCPSEAMSD